MNAEGGEMTNLKYHEAMRLGAMLHPQGFGALIDRVDGVSVTCAEGAALAGSIGFKQLVAPLSPWQDITMIRVKCPVCSRKNYVGGTIVHLNDEHRWTRERIADWLEPIENAFLEAKSEGVPAMVEAP